MYPPPTQVGHVVIEIFIDYRSMDLLSSVLATTAATAGALSEKCSPEGCVDADTHAALPLPTVPTGDDSGAESAMGVSLGAVTLEEGVAAKGTTTPCNCTLLLSVWSCCVGSAVMCIIVFVAYGHHQLKHLPATSAAL